MRWWSPPGSDSDGRKPGREEVDMLERYSVRPETIDRIGASSIDEGIERYVA